MNLLITNNPPSPVVPVAPHPWRSWLYDREEQRQFTAWAWAASEGEALAALNAKYPISRYRMDSCDPDAKAHPWQCVNAPKDGPNVSR